MEDFLGAGSWLPVIAAFLPLVTGFLLKSTASDKVKTVTNIVVTAVYALAAQAAAEGGILTVETAQTWAYSLVISIATYYGVWKPLGAGNAAPNVGIGGGESEDVPAAVAEIDE